MIDYSHDDNVRDATRMAEMFLALNTLPAAVVGRIHGAALGGGAGPHRDLRHRRRRRRRDLRLHRDQARHSAGGDLAVRPAEDRPLGRARAVSHRHAVLRGACQGDRPGARGRSRPTSSMPPSRRYVPSCCRPRRPASPRQRRCIPQVWGRVARRRHGDRPPTAIATQRVSPEGQDGLRAFLEKRQARAGCQQ